MKPMTDHPRIEIDRRTFLRGVAGGAGVVLLGGCRGSTGEGGPRTAGSTLAPGVDPRTLPAVPRPTLRLPGGALGFPSPFGYVAVPGYRQMSLIYDTLLWKDSTNQLLPWLASKWERSEDGLRYTFDLRDDVKWHDGKPFTADDVVFTFEYYGKHTLGPLVVLQPYGIAKVDAPSPGRVVFELDRPDVTFPTILAAGVPIAPRHVWSSVDDPLGAQDTDLLVGTGAYRCTSYGGDGDPLQFESNDKYFLGRPFVKSIGMAPASDELTSLLAGEIDVAEANVVGTRADALAPFTNDPATWGIVEAPGGFCFPLFWNLSKGDALGDVAFRRACALAIDRKDVVERITGGNGSPGNPGFLAPTNPYHVKVEQYEYDLAAANRMLDKAGYTGGGDGGGVRRSPKGKELRFELLFPSMLSALAAVVRDYLQKIGVELTLKGVELGPALYGKKLAGDYEMALVLYPGPSGPDPNADPDLLRPLFSSQAAKGLNSVNGYVDEEFDDLAERQLATVDEAERKRLVGRMQVILARDIPMMPIYFATLFNVFRRSVFDQWNITPGGFPVGSYNRQLFITGVKAGSEIRPNL